MTAPLEIAGATLTLNPDGVVLKYGWWPAVEISRADALKIRDWLEVYFPKVPAK